MIPGGLRNQIQSEFSSTLPLSQIAHFLLFFALALILIEIPINIRLSRVFIMLAILAFMTEGFQYFAIDRHPRLIDIGLDLSGVFLSFLIFQYRKKYWS